MDVSARRVFRLSLTVSLSLAIAYGMALEFPYLAPIFGFMLSAKPQPPMGLKGLLGLSLLLSLTLGIGLLLIPILINYPLTGLVLVGLGLFLSNYISIHLGKGPVGALMTMGITLISAAGYASFGLAVDLISGLIVGVTVAVVCQWIIYPFFPEDDNAPAVPDPVTPESQSIWIAARATLIIMPTYLLGLINPSVYLSTIMKAVNLGQQASESHSKDAGKELLGSTMAGGILSMCIWFGLSIAPNLWMFFLWILLFSLYVSAKFYGVSPSRFQPSYWSSVLITTLILVGPAVADSANGKDVYKAFAIRISLFVAVAIYAWLAIKVLDYWKNRKAHSPMPE
ncbi:MAG: DUF2955 domain-containing protein [Pseudomonadales bacterium]